MCHFVRETGDNEGNVLKTRQADLVFFLFCRTKKMNGSLDHPDQPDIDAIKMFVGQIPRTWSEDQLRELFEPYGAVYEINVLRDRSQNPPQSKGILDSQYIVD